MATKTSKTKKATKMKVRQTMPKPASPYIADMRFGMYEDASGKMATKLVKFREDWADHKVKCKAHYAEGGTEKDLPEFDEKKYPDPNTGMVTYKQNDALEKKWDKGENVVFSPKYNPVRSDLVSETGCIHLRKGAVDKHPKPPSDWDEAEYGSWYLISEDEDGNEIQKPSGWFFDKEKPRCPHPKTAEKMVDDPTDNILTIGNARYVVGTGDHEGSAAFLIRAHRGTNNFGNIDSCRKRMSSASIKGLSNIVFKIEDKANNGGAFVLKADWLSTTSHVRAVAFMPGQVLTPGNLFDGDKQLTAKQIRALSTDAKGIKFKVCEATEGKDIPWEGEDGLWAEIKVAEGRKGLKKLKEREGRSEYEQDDKDTTAQARSLVNFGTTMRILPNEYNPFGFRSLVIGMMPTRRFNADGSFTTSVIFGERNGYDHNIGKREGARVDEVDEVDEVVDSKPKKKSTKKRAAKKVSDEAALVEDEVIEVEDEVSLEFSEDEPVTVE